VSRRSLLKGALAALLAAVALCAGAFAWLRLAPRRTPAGQPPLAILDSGSLASFRDAFNAGEGRVRLLVMLSPT